MEKKKKYKTCPECEGTGSIGGTPAHVYDSYASNIERSGKIEECQVCNATGRIEIKEPEST